MFDYYRQHSLFTDLSEYKAIIAELPNDISKLVDIVQGILIHRIDGHLLGFNIAKERLVEMELRKVSSMLKAIFAINPAPLFEKRPYEQRLISSCRDFALFLCALLREKGIPARIRVGFTHYLFGGTQDHLLTEYWCERKNKWLLVDSRLTPEYIKKLPKLQNIDLLNVNTNDFFVAGKIWLDCRLEKDDPDRYGYGLIRSIRGMRHIQDKVIQDLASLNKVEVLPWDLWGYMIKDKPGVSPYEKSHLLDVDNVAKLTSDPDIEKIQMIYQKSQFALSTPILSASPILEKYYLTKEELLNAT